MESWRWMSKYDAFLCTWRHVYANNVNNMHVENTWLLFKVAYDWSQVGGCPKIIVSKNILWTSNQTQMGGCPRFVWCFFNRYQGVPSMVELEKKFFDRILVRIYEIIQALCREISSESALTCCHESQKVIGWNLIYTFGAICLYKGFCAKAVEMGCGTTYEKFKENLNPKPSPGSYLKSLMGQIFYITAHDGLNIRGFIWI